MKLLSEDIKNKVLQSMERILDEERNTIIEANKNDLDAFNSDDKAMYDRLVVNKSKIDGMIQAVREVREQQDPVGKLKSSRELDNGLRIENRTAPFGTIMIIYESRPDVTIEAAVLAFKANNKILLKGGKEARFSNEKLEKCWHKALEENGLEPENWIKLLQMNREETQEFLKHPTEKLDLVVPRGGERLIRFVKDNAECAVLISGRGNNFLYVHKEGDWDCALDVIVNAKTDKISACNALDKILVDRQLPGFEDKVKQLASVLREHKVELLTDRELQSLLPEAELIEDESVWYEEFLALKAVIAATDGIDDAIERINTYSGGHSASVITRDSDTARSFMEQVDSAAVYQNASTRFTDGGQMGVGAELAISTDKLHHRGPLGLEQLVTNKYYVYGNGQVRA
ncbi:glutamate-5-semialdehyde dehydrogenase [Sinomicrobium sp.]